MNRKLALSSAVVLLFSQLISAQSSPQPPNPGPEHKKLSYFIGKWSSAGEAKPSPFGPAGKFTFTDDSTWFPGGFFVVSRSDGKGPAGEIKTIAVMGYDPNENVYTYNAFNSMGMAESAKGTVNGDTWTWTSGGQVGDKTVKSRFIMTVQSPTTYTYKWESSADGGDWITIMEGASTKIGPSGPEKKAP